jgi:hypothetical protein
MHSLGHDTLTMETCGAIHLALHWNVLSFGEMQMRSMMTQQSMAFCSASLSYFQVHSLHPKAADPVQDR